MRGFRSLSEPSSLHSTSVVSEVCCTPFTSSGPLHFARNILVGQKYILGGPFKRMNQGIKTTHNLMRAPRIRSSSTKSRRHNWGTQAKEARMWDLLPRKQSPCRTIKDCTTSALACASHFGYEIQRSAAFTAVPAGPQTSLYLQTAWRPWTHVMFSILTTSAPTHMLSFSSLCPTNEYTRLKASLSETCREGQRRVATALTSLPCFVVCTAACNVSHRKARPRVATAMISLPHFVFSLAALNLSHRKTASQTLLMQWF